jgi:SAM-dependent methyltransferase
MTKMRQLATLSLLMILMAVFATTSMSQTTSAQAPARSNPEGSPIMPQTPSGPLVHFEAVNPGETWGGGDKLALPRQIAAAVVAQDNPSPKLVVDVGSFTGEFLEAFLEKFPGARGQWTEPVEGNRANAKRRFARFGDRVDYVIGCPARDISDGCVPKSADVIISSWMSIHQNRDGIYKFYRLAAAQLPPGGWLIHMDHVGFPGSAGFRWLDWGSTRSLKGPQFTTRTSSRYPLPITWRRSRPQASMMSK